MVGQPTHTLIENIRNKLSKIGAFIKTTHTSFPEGTKFGYTSTIMMAGEYRKRVTTLDSACMFTKSTKLATYNLSIKTSTSELPKAQKETSCELR